MAGPGVYLYLLLTTGNLVQGNYIGTDPNGSTAVPNAANGVTVTSAAGNTIGGTTAGSGNLISGNGQGGLSLNGTGCNDNLVQGNLIGTDASGRLALGNSFSGITIFGANTNLIGGATTGARNIISGNKLAGIYITTNSSGNSVQGNFIGVDTLGTGAIGNAKNGLSIDSASFNIVGGTTAAARNIISGNTNHGIEIYTSLATGNLIQGNYIGADISGQSAIANKLCGLHLQAPANLIGGSANGAGNLISGNAQDGIFLDGTSAASNVVQGNFIGTSADGTSALGNLRGGVGISEAPANLIGGADSRAGNLISANVNYHGIWLFGTGATRNLIQGNKIGTDVTGNVALFSGYQGIYLESAVTNTIGGAVPGAGNLISANNRSGIYLTKASWNIIQGNLIGTKSDGVTALGNLLHALDCQPGSCNNTIGGTDAGAGNRLAFSRTYSGSGYAGARIRSGSTNNAVLGNAIFSNDGLGIDLGTVGISPNISCGGSDGTAANMAQNFPLLTQAVSGNGTSVRGTLNSRPNQMFALQFFANPAADPSGYGEGQVYLGQMNVTTSNNCSTSFVASFPSQVPVGYVISATATDGANNTSEFSACIPVGPVPALAVSPATGNQVRLTWTNTATGFVLKQTDSLSPPVQWTNVSTSPIVSNGQFVVTVPADQARRYYALRFE